MEAPQGDFMDDALTIPMPQCRETLRLSEPNEGEEEQGRRPAQTQETAQHWRSLLEDGQHAQVKKLILRVATAARLSIPSSIRQATRLRQTSTMAGRQHAVDR